MHRSHHSLFTRPLQLVAAFALLLAPLLGLAPTASAQTLPNNCTQSGTTVTCSFGYTGAEQTFVVPANASNIQAVIVGAGGYGSNRGLGGRGARVSAALPSVQPGDTLYIQVGGASGNRTGGFNGGGNGGNGGGGASDIRTKPRSAADTLDSRLIVAGGGGGAGDTVSLFNLNGGDAGVAGVGTVGPNTGGGGQPGTSTGGGQGGAPSTAPPQYPFFPQKAGGNGTKGQGGNGGDGGAAGFVGGGGGGGFYGGDGGGGADDPSGFLNSGGGGGGSSYDPDGGPITFGDRYASGSITISYTIPAPTIIVDPQSIPNSTVGVPYSVQLSASGTSSPVTFAVSDGELPSGLLLSSDGELSGVPTEAGIFTFTATATDGNGFNGSREYTLTIAKAATSTTVTSTPNPSAVGQQVTVSATVTASTGTPTGNVLVTASDGASCTSTLANGQAICTITFTSAGVKNLTATYNGDPAFTSSSAFTTHTVFVPNQPPTAISLSATSVRENQPAGTTVGTFSATDPDSGDSFTYALVSGDTNSFTLEGNALKTAASFDYEAKNSYTIGVQVTDSGGATFTQNVTINVTDVAENPPANGVLDTFNRANGRPGSNWGGLTTVLFYRIANNTLDVQAGGPLVWKQSFGTNQEAFITLSTIDTKSPSQGVLLKVQADSAPDAGAISVVYDALAKAVRVSTLRVGDRTWTLYGNKKVTFTNGDKLGAKALNNGTVEIYKNGSLITTVTLSAKDQAFFNPKGGRIGIWTVAAPKAVFDDFGGGTLRHKGV